MPWARAWGASSGADLPVFRLAPILRAVLNGLALKAGGRLWALVLVLTVALSALASGGAAGSAPLGLRHGSAFSSDTVEMAVAPARQIVAEMRVVALPPVPVLPALVLVLVALVPLGLRTPTRRWPASTGPPLAALPLASPGTARAPPLP